MKQILKEWQRFLNEDIEKKKFLIFVHPDAASQLPKEECLEYFENIKRYIPSHFDIVITHFMYSYEFQDLELGKKEENYEELLEIRKYLESTTNHLHDKNLGKESFNEATLDVITNYEPGELEVYMAGGYQDLCLAHTYNNFCDLLGDIMKEQGIDFKIFKPLVFYRRGGPYNPKTERYDISVKDWWRGL